MPRATLRSAGRLSGVLAGAAIAVGCVSPALAPAPDAVRRTRSVVIVAMEAPPLGVPPEFRAIVPGGVVAVAAPLLVYNTIAVLIEMPAASRRAAEASASAQVALDAGSTWMPTLVAAEEARTQLAARGIEARVAPGVRPISGVRARGHSLLMENWLAPIRAWYNDASPVPRGDHAADVEPATWVLEVGVLNYEITGDRLLLQVVVKLVDPASGGVIGRARAVVDPERMPRTGPLDQAFAGDADAFKQTVAVASRTLVRTCLVRLGLVD